MPALPASPGDVKITIVQSLAGVSVYNVLHASGPNSAGYTSTELGSLASAVRSAWVTNVIPLQATALTLTDVVVDDLSNDLGARGIASGSNAGTAGGTIVPASVAVCWSWKIANRYRGGHPRTYIGGVTASGMSNQNTWLSTYVTSHTNAATAIRTAINTTSVGGSTWTLICLSYYKDKALRPDPVPRPISGVSVDTRIDSQRRRLGRDRI